MVSDLEKIQKKIPLFIASDSKIFIFFFYTFNKGNPFELLEKNRFEC